MISITASLWAHFPLEIRGVIIEQRPLVIFKRHFVFARVAGVSIKPRVLTRGKEPNAAKPA